MTASTPVRPDSSRATGMPPPPHAITICLARRSSRTCGHSTTSIGTGEATTLRQPRPASSTTSHPRAWASRFARPAEKNGPIGFVGVVKPGSPRSTTTWVTTAATARSWPRASSSSPIAWPSMNPSCPCVIAPSTWSGCGGTSRATASCASASAPTCGPLPWTTTRRRPPSSSATACPATFRARSICSANSPSPEGARAFPPTAMTTISLTEEFSTCPGTCNQSCVGR